MTTGAGAPPSTTFSPTSATSGNASLIKSEIPASGANGTAGGDSMSGGVGDTRTAAAFNSASNPPTVPAAAVLSRPVSPVRVSRDKGKQRADPGPGRPLLPAAADAGLSSMLSEALSSPLEGLPPARRATVDGSSQSAGSFASPSASPTSPTSPRMPRNQRRAASALIPRPQPAAIAPSRSGHPPEHLRASLRPRLVSNLTRSTLPTSSLTYAYAEDHWQDQGWRHEYRLVETHGESSGSSSAGAGSSTVGTSSGARPSLQHVRTQSHTYRLTRYSDEFPDLDPATGLPEARGDAGQEKSDVPERLRVQRTISQLSSRHASPAEPTRTPAFGISGLPPLPSMSMGMKNVNLNLGLGNLRERSSRSSSELSQSLRRTFTTSSSTSSSKKKDSGEWWNSLWGGNKDRVDSMLAKDDQAATVQEEKAKIAVKYATPKHPMVFCHGLLGFDYLGPEAVPALQISHWRGIREVLEANGVEVMIARVPATSSIKDRATILHGLIAERYGGRTVNLVAHSMGGLDCRYLISELAADNDAFKVASLTTISTPHRGSPFADYVIDNVIGRERLPQLLGLMEAMKLPETSGDGSAFAALGTRAMAEFNAEVVDDPEVKYYSWGASFEPGLLDTFRWPWSVIMSKEGPNDGLVSVTSAKWGEYRGTLLGVNHLDLVGWVSTFRYMFSELTGKPIAFKPATFYLEVSDYLAKQGF